MRSDAVLHIDHSNYAIQDAYFSYERVIIRTLLPLTSQDELLLSSVGRRSRQWAADVLGGYFNESGAYAYAFRMA